MTLVVFISLGSEHQDNIVYLTTLQSVRNIWDNALPLALN